MTDSKVLEVSIVIPLFNEEVIIEDFNHLLTQTLDSLPHQFHIIYVDDGSTDGTTQIIHELLQNDPRIGLITLSRNFGHQAALTCGIDQAMGDVLITLDGDGQNPPGLIPEMLDLYQTGYDIVTAQRVNNATEKKLKQLTSRAFYQLINKIGNLNITPNAADFRLLSRPAYTALRSMPEYHRFLRGMVSWVGFKSVILPFEPQPRLGGESKYTFKKMISLAGDAIFSFSLVPLRIGLAVGGLFYLLAAIEVIYVLSLWLLGRQAQIAPGWSSLMFMLLIVGGTLTTVISFIGIYVGYIFQEVKQRPVYIIKENSIAE